MITENTNIQERFKILDSLPLGEIVLRKDLVVLFWNHCLEEWSGIKKNKIEGKKITEHYPDLLKFPFLQEQLKTVFEDGGSVILSAQLHKYFLPILGPYGKMRMQETTIIPVTIADDKKTGALITIQDVTEQLHHLQEYRVIRESAVAEAEEHKKAKKALNSSEKLYKLITENAKDLIALHSIPKLNYLYLNPSTEKVLGYSKEELLGKSAIGLIHPKDRLRVLKAVTKGIIRGEGSEEFRYRKKDGSYIWVEVTGKLTKDEQGQRAGLIFSRDITKRKKIEEELHRYKKHLEEQVHERTIELTTANEQLRRDIIERKNAAEQRIQLEQQLQQSKKLESIGTLAAGIAHEINTPLQFIGDNSRFLSEIIEKLLTLINTYRNLLSECEHGEKTNNAIKKAKESEQTVDLEYITEEIPKAISQTQEGLSRVTKIVNAMKDFSHMDTDEKIEANINKAIENTITVSRNEWKYVAEMKTDLTPSLPPIHCFLGDINQVVMNLIVNAAHAIANVVGDGSKDKGEITITTRHENNSVIITVADTGTGIPENIRDKIFDPFFTTKKIGKGTGQGLSMAYASIVEKHKGKLIFDTKLGKGTTFIIELPLKKK